jgi:hypothetical protein
MISRMKPTALAVLFVLLTGCRFFLAKAKPEPIPAPDPPRPVVVTPPPAKVEPAGPPPKIETKQPPEVPATVATIPVPPAPKPRRRQPRKPAPTTAAATQPATPPVTTEGVPPSPPVTNTVPKLGELLSEDQKAQYLKAYEESLARARDVVTKLKGASLSTDQKSSLARVKTFIYQAEQAHQKDPQTARQLAERADLLARDLVRTVR